MKPGRDIHEAIHYARQDIGCYLMAMMPNAKIARVHDFIIGQLIDALSGRYDRLMVFMPPGTGKSTLVGITFPAWYLGHYPDRYVIDVSYSQNVADDLGRGTRNLVSDPIHRAIFPESIITRDSRAAHKFSLTAGGRFNAVGINGSITGKRAHLAIVDDWVKDHLEANSTAEQIKAHEWYKSVLYTRLIDDAIIILSGTRWAHADLAGRVMEDADNYHVVRIPAKAGDDDSMGRQPGEWHYPERFPANQMERIQSNISERWWNALYQQEPVLNDGTLFKRSMFQYGKPNQSNYIIQSWDTAFEDAGDSDFSAATTWVLDGDNYYCLDAVKYRVKSTELYNKVIAYAGKYKAVVVLIEDKGSGKTLLHRLQREATGIHGMPWNPGQASKVARAIDVLDCFEMGKVYFAGKWVDYENELLSFPFGRHDDWVDSTTQALAYLRNMAAKRSTDVMTTGANFGSRFRNF